MESSSSDPHHHHHRQHQGQDHPHEHGHGDGAGFGAEVAASWDKRDTVRMLSERALEYSQAEFGLLGRASLLDFGAGTGMTAMIALARPDCAVQRLLGIDVSPDMIAEFQKKVDAYAGAAR